VFGRQSWPLHPHPLAYAHDLSLGGTFAERRKMYKKSYRGPDITVPVLLIEALRTGTGMSRPHCLALCKGPSGREMYDLPAQVKKLSNMVYLRFLAQG